MTYFKNTKENRLKERECEIKRRNATVVYESKGGCLATFEEVFRGGSPCYSLMVFKGSAGKWGYHVFSSEEDRKKELTAWQESFERKAHEVKGHREMSSHALTAKRIRERLKNLFPGVKFSVTTDSFAGGDSCDIVYTDGAPIEAVEYITNQYQHSHSDYSGDYWDYDGIDEEKLQCHGCKFVMARRELSEERKAEILKDFSEKTGKKDINQFYFENDNELYCLLRWEKEHPELIKPEYRKIMEEQEKEQEELRKARQEEEHKKWEEAKERERQEEEARRVEAEIDKKVISMSAWKEAKKAEEKQAEEKANAEKTIISTIKKMSIEELEEFGEAVSAGKDEEAKRLLIVANFKQKIQKI